MILDIVSDTICPWCYIGKRRLERALAERPVPDLRINWHPFQLNPGMPEGGMDRKAYMRAKFGNDDAGAIYRRVEEAGRSEGIPFAFDKIVTTPNTLASHRLIRHAQRQARQEEMVETLFRAYFTLGANIGDPATLETLAESAGLDRAATKAYLAGEEDREQIRAEDRQAREIGVTGVPFFIFDQKLAISGAQPPAAFLQVFERLASAA